MLGVKRVLLTGMSGTGKSSIVRELVARGHKAVDTDDGWSDPQPDGRQMWREDVVRQLLSTEDAEILFVAGCEENQVVFHPAFDHIILLTAPLPTLLDRLATRTDNPFGKDPEELRRFLEDVGSVEPLLRRVADAEICTARPLDEVVTAVLRVANGRPDDVVGSTAQRLSAAPCLVPVAEDPRAMSSGRESRLPLDHTHGRTGGSP